LICRDYTSEMACSGSPSTNFTIAIGKTDLCDENGKEVEASAGLSTGIETFYDSDRTVPQSIFQTGDMVYFKLSVKNPSSTIDQITFNQIRVYTSADSTVEDPLYHVINPGDLPSAADVFNLDAQFNITQEYRDLSYLEPNAEGDLNFNFRLLRNHLNVVNTLSSVSADSMTQQLTVEVIIDILYHGNQKRTFVATSNVPAMTHTSISFYDMGENAEDLEPHTNDASAMDASHGSLFASPASTIAASCVAVVAAAAVILA